MTKTCMNCSHYHDVLESSRSSGYHVHNYCDFWRMALRADLTEIHQLLKLADSLGIDVSDIFPVWDDMEEGVSECYMFNPVQNPEHDDEWFKEHHKQNLVKLVKLQSLIDDKIGK